MKYIIGIDQSTQGTKALVFDGEGSILYRADVPHRQIINELGWVSHDPEEIYRNVIRAVKMAVEGAAVPKEQQGSATRERLRCCGTWGAGRCIPPSYGSATGRRILRSG